MLKWNKDENLNKGYKYVLFLCSPFLSLVYSLRSVNTKSSYIVFYLFAVFFGLSFTVTSDWENSSNKIDGMVYRAYFEQESNNVRYSRNNAFMNYAEGLKGFLSFDDGKKDYYRDTINHFIARFTDNYHVMFMVVAMFFAFFQLKTLRFFTSHKNFDNTIFSLILLFLFTYNGIFNINGFRFWTAAWVAIYSVFKIFLVGDRRYLILAVFTPFFHGSFWFFIAILAIAFCFRKYDKAWIIAFFLSFFFSSFISDFIEISYSVLPTFITRMIDSYASDEAIERRTSIQGTGFYFLGVIFKTLLNIYINVLIVLLIRKIDIIKKNAETYSLYQFFIVFVTITNFVMFIPSLGGRYLLFTYPMLAYIILACYKDMRYSKNWIYILPFVFFMSLQQLVRLYVMVLDETFFVSSPFYLIYKYLLS